MNFWEGVSGVELFVGSSSIVMKSFRKCDRADFEIWCSSGGGSPSHRAGGCWEVKHIFQVFFKVVKVYQMGRNGITVMF